MEVQEERVLCTFCNKPRALYFCLECKSLFCEDCAHIEIHNYNFCGKCHSTDLRELKEKKGDQETIRVMCLRCGSSQIKKGKKKTQLCPACEKHSFENISTYRHHLYNQYREFCNQLTIALVAIHPSVKKMDWYRERVLALRGQGYFIYPILEEKLLEAYLSFDAIKKKILDRESHYLSILRHYILDFSNKKHISPYMFKKYKENLETIELEFTLYRRSIDNLLENFTELFAELEGTLNILDYYRDNFEMWKDALNLSPKEVPLCNLSEVICTGGSSSLSLTPGRGHIFFTNQRMIFVGRKGLLSKSVMKFFDIPTSKVIGCKLDEGIFSRKVLVTLVKDGVVKFSGDKKVLVTLVKYVEFMKEWKKHCVSENLTEDLRRCEVTLSDIRRKIDEDIQGLLNNMALRLPHVALKPRFRVKSERVEQPKIIPRVRKKQTNPAILKRIGELEREKYSLLKTIEALEAKFRAGGIPKEFYMQKYRALTGELYTVDSQLDELNAEVRGTPT